jgi:hypothetical protein
MNHTENLDDDVKNILAILQQGGAQEEAKAPFKSEKKAKPVAKAEKTPISDSKPIVLKTILPTPPKPKGFLANMEEPADKSIFNSKVLIREELYEIFMSLKRAQKLKSVSTLIDFALEEYIKNHREEIKAVLYNSKKQSIL